MFNRKKQHKAAFSLVEMIVSMSIIVLLTALFLANYRASNKRTDLVMTAQVLVTDIRYAQANALGLVKYDGAMPSGGWGVHFSSLDANNSNYIIFADSNDNKEYDDGEAAENLGGRIVSLPTNIIIKEILLGQNASISANNFDVTFLPPDPITRLYNGIEDGNVARIVLENIASGDEKTIYLNFLGLVEVED